MGKSSGSQPSCYSLSTLRFHLPAILSVRGAATEGGEGGGCLHLLCRAGTKQTGPESVLTNPALKMVGKEIVEEKGDASLDDRKGRSG